MISKAEIDDELQLNMSDAFFSEMKNTEEKKFKQFYQWSESDNFAAELEHCLSKKCHADTTPHTHIHTHAPREFTLPSIIYIIYTDLDKSDQNITIIW